MRKRFAHLLAFTSCIIAAQAQDKPNIVVFLVDDMGLMDTQVPFLTDAEGKPVRYPLNDWYRTPNMERLANQGIRFSTFYAQSVSSPSRACIMTGQNATRHGTTNWIDPWFNNKTTFGPKDWNWNGISKNDVTIPKILQQAGYRTIHIGKGHFGNKNSDGANPENIGFDVNVAGTYIGHPGSYYGEQGYGKEENSKYSVPDLEKYHNTETFLTEALTIEAKNELTKVVSEKKPFFLYMSHYAVHSPFYVDKRFAQNYTDSDKSEQAKAFATLIEGMDKSLGDIMDKLEELGVAENTIIIFLGDNGSDAPLGDPKGHTSSAPLRGKKATEYEGGMRVPFIAAWGKTDKKNKWQKTFPIKEGAIQQQMGTVMDIYPTLVSLTSTKNPNNHVVDGVDLKAQLAGEKNTKRSERFLMHFPHKHNGSYFTSFRNGDWKLIYRYNPEQPDRPLYELYNLAIDECEYNNLAENNKEILTAMVKQMVEQLKSEGALYPESEQGIIKPIIP